MTISGLHDPGVLAQENLLYLYKQFHYFFIYLIHCLASIRAKAKGAQAFTSRRACIESAIFQERMNT